MACHHQLTISLYLQGFATTGPQITIASARIHSWEPQGTSAKCGMRSAFSYLLQVLLLCAVPHMHDASAAEVLQVLASCHSLQVLWN